MNWQSQMDIAAEQTEPNADEKKKTNAVVETIQQLGQTCYSRTDRVKYFLYDDYWTSGRASRLASAK